jgi:hypothetical protein
LTFAAQGLFYDDEAGDHLIECTGMWGQSSIRRLRASDGQVLQSRLISDSSWFGEGCFKARAGVGVMMTWKNWVAFEFNTTTFEEIRRIPWPREGWGISGDGGSKVYATDGSNSIFSLHPSSYADVATIPVKIAVQSSIQTSRLNEVELVDNQVGLLRVIMALVVAGQRDGFVVRSCPTYGEKITSSESTPNRYPLPPQKSFSVYQYNFFALLSMLMHTCSGFGHRNHRMQSSAS